jgi:hypothetical protein
LFNQPGASAPITKESIMQQLELFPLNLRDTVAREYEQRLIKERDDALFAVHYEYECRTETQLVNPVAYDWWWADEYTDTVIVNFPNHVTHIYGADTVQFTLEDHNR